jgi:hypothetical protein
MFEGRVTIGYDVRMPCKVLRKGCGPKNRQPTLQSHKSTARLIVKLKIAAL